MNRGHSPSNAWIFSPICRPGRREVLPAMVGRTTKEFAVSFRRPLIAALVFGFSCIAGSAFAQNADFEVKKAEVASQDGRTAQIKVFGGKRGGGPNQKPIKVYWVEGNNRREIYSGNVSFDGTVTGFQNTITVNLPAESGRIEVEAVNAGDPTPPNNKKLFEVGGSDLSFDPALINQKAGGNPNRELVLTVANNGPLNLAAGCKLEIDLAERAPARHISVNIPALPRRAKFQKKVPFHFVASNTATHNTVTARIDCDADKASGNNRQEMRLR